MAASHHNLDISEDLDHLRMEWRAEKIGWALMLILVLAGVAGVFGSGPISWREVGDEGAALRIEYQRFERFRAQSVLKMRINPTLTGAAPRITVSQSFNENFRITEIVPEPESVEAGADALVFEFAVTGTEGPVLITFHIESMQSGRAKSRLGLEGLLHYDINQFIFP